jgi:hypothetical protein
VLLVVRNGADRRLGFLGEGGHQINRWCNSIANQQDHRASLETADSLAHVANWKNANAVEAKSLECVLKGLRNALHDNHNRRGPGGSGAANLIFEQSATGQRKQSAKPAAIVLLIGSDQRADRHSAPALPLASHSLL